MKTVFRQTQLFKFLLFCENNPLDKTILDCGAGGNCPPLALFAEYGYNTLGIELSDNQINKAREFETMKNLKLNIEKGDMRKLPFEDNSISYVFSYNAVFHMTKKDILSSVNEMKRVLKPGGLCFVNFLTTKDFGYGQGEKVGEGEFRQKEREDYVIHTYFEENEGDSYFEDMEIIHKESRIVNRIFLGEKIKQSYVDYIVKKSSDK